ncbi:hypothetical protein [Methylibium sp. Root1272]|uniref:hypothetical protein n=1 Tax=Methylibium sp. Root1272 TaxID=1736441 RepID=UPI0006F9B29C|nr:hypothetical protein [Methylibium sp. Root1272]KQW70050.1 hypothetical protein ASC67_06120 [Methylibium sp. Root1272]
MSQNPCNRTYLEIIQDVLNEQVGRNPRSIYELPVSRREYLFKLLRKLAVQGNTEAFRLMERERRSHARTVAMLNAAQSAGLQTEYWPLIQGGVVNVPRGESIDEVVEMFERGITTEELSRLMDLARRDAFDQLREAEEIRERLEEERLANLANPSSNAHLGPDEHTSSDTGSKLPQVRWGPPVSLLPPIDLSQAPATRPRIILPPDLPPDAYPPGY